MQVSLSLRRSVQRRLLSHPQLVSGNPMTSSRCRVETWVVVHMVGIGVLLFWDMYDLCWPFLYFGNVNLNLTNFCYLETWNLYHGNAMLYILTLNVYVFWTIWLIHLGILCFTLINCNWDYLHASANHYSCEIVPYMFWNLHRRNLWDNHSWTH